MQLTEYHIPKNPVICEMNGAVNPSNSEWLTRGASVGSLPLFPPASSLAGARHHHGHHQWPKTAATRRQDIDASDAAAAGRLGRTAQTPRLSLKTNRRSLVNFREPTLAPHAIALNSRGVRCS